MPTIDELIYQAHFGSPTEQATAQADIWNQALQQGCGPASIYPIYAARGRNELSHTFTVPAFNLRGLPYHSAQAAFRAAQHHQAGLIIFELARSEMGYTAQPPAVYASTILAAAIATNWRQPVFIQGDHYQAKAAAPGVAQDGETAALKKLIDQSLTAGFYNIDLDASTLVDLSQPTELEQQRANFELAAELADYIRDRQPSGVMVSLGGEIGEVGKSNSRPEELAAYMQGFTERFGTERPGLAKVAIQTGTRHGGVVSAEGKNQTMTVDFALIKGMSQLARDQYGMGGVVQHGASTLSPEVFSQFPAAEAIEIHLSTGFQNLIFDHPAFPAELRQAIYSWCDANCADERKPDHTDAQFHYTTRKKAWGPFKQQLWDLPAATLEPIMTSLQKEVSDYIDKLGVANTTELVDQYIKPITAKKIAQDYLAETNHSATADATDLAD